MSTAPSACRFLEQLYFRACAIRCDDDVTINNNNRDSSDAQRQANNKRTCVDGCRLASGRPLQSAVLAYTLFGIEEDTVHDNVLSEMERRTISSRMQSISNGIQQACAAKECADHCGEGQGEACLQACRAGCAHFVFPLRPS